MKKQLIYNKIQISGFILYFLFLFIERILAIILSVNANNEYGLVNPSFISISTYTVTLISVLIGTILFIKPIVNMAKVLFTKSLYDFSNNIKPLIIASMALLFSGMMHTGFTYPGLQFIAYGFLLLSLLARTMENANRISITSLIYISLFSMSIPVVYSISISPTINVLFYVFEYIGVFTLIPILGMLFYAHYKNYKTQSSIIIPIYLLIIVGVILGLKWTQEINYFVLIATSITLIAYIPFKIYCKRE